jgi:sugar/nucleoside kinase (ribokinase family)
MSKILAIGDIYLETQFFVDAVPGENNFAFSEQMNATVGSKVINAARVLRKLGSEVTYAGKVGSDAASSGAVEALRGYGLTPNVSTVEKRRFCHAKPPRSRTLIRNDNSFSS